MPKIKNFFFFLVKTVYKPSVMKRERLQVPEKFLPVSRAVGREQLHARASGAEMGTDVSAMMYMLMLHSCFSW